MSDLIFDLRYLAELSQKSRRLLRVVRLASVVHDTGNESSFSRSAPMGQTFSFHLLSHRVAIMNFNDPFALESDCAFLRSFRYFFGCCIHKNFKGCLQERSKKWLKTRYIKIGSKLVQRSKINYNILFI